MKKLFINIPKNAGMTIRGSESFLEHIVPVQRKWIANFKDFNQTMKAYGERDVKGVEHARWRDISSHITDQHQAFAVVRNPWSKVVSRYLFAKEAVNDFFHSLDFVLQTLTQFPLEHRCLLKDYLILLRYLLAACSLLLTRFDDLVVFCILHVLF